MKTFSLLTYNLLFNKAYQNLESILKKWQPDIICLQEVDTSDENLNRLERMGYKLSDYINSFMQFGRIWGVATFYNPKKLIFRGAKSVNLSKNISEVLFNLLRILLGVSQPRTILKTDFIFKSIKKKFTVCNMHLVFIATNAVRLSHIKQTLNTIAINSTSPYIITGDFNYYPYSRKKLETVMKTHGFKEATKKLRYSFNVLKNEKFQQYNLIQRLLVKIYHNTHYINSLKPDYTFYKYLTHVDTKRIEVRFSDHFPILSTFRI